MRLIWYTAMSIDGRLADARHSLDYLSKIGDRPDARSEFPDFIASIDAIVIGATTLRWLVSNGHKWPHDDLPTWLISHDESLVGEIGPTRAPFHRVEGDVAVALEQIDAAGHDRVWLCGGGSIASQCLAAGRLDEVIVTIAPTVVGEGPVVFDGFRLPENRFRLVECRDAGGDAARLHWVVEEPASVDADTL